MRTTRITYGTTALESTRQSNRPLAHRTVAPSTSAPATDTNSELFAYPKAGQSEEQQARDRD
jgi:hypothetical protein